MIDIEPRDERSFMKMLHGTIAEAMTEQVIETGSYDDDTIKSFMCTIISEDFEINFLKAIGLIHYKDDENAMRIVNDFCGVLSDIMHDGKKDIESMNSRV